MISAFIHVWRRQVLQEIFVYWRLTNVYVEMYTYCHRHFVKTIEQGIRGTNFSEILIEIITLSFIKKRLKVSSAKWRPFCLNLNVLTTLWLIAWGRYDQLAETSLLQVIVCFLFGIIAQPETNAELLFRPRNKHGCSFNLTPPWWVNNMHSKLSITKCRPNVFKLCKGCRTT